MGTKFSRKLLPAGVIVLFVTVASCLTGCLTDSKDGDKSTNVTTSWTMDSVLTVGAQGNVSYGTAIDLDKRRVLLSLAANAAQDSLDVLFAYHNSSFVLIAPRTAKDSGITVAANYDTAKVQYVQFVKVETAPANWDAGKVAYDAGVKVSYSPVAPGDIFVVKTTEGDYSLLTLMSINGSTATGSGVIKINIKGMAH